MHMIRLLVRKIVLSLFLAAAICNLSAGEKDSLRQKVYHLNYYVDLPVTAVAMATSFWGFAVVDKKSPLDSITIIGLNANDVNGFDRSATWQDPGFAPTARRISDVTLGICNALPFLLLADREIRKDWGDVLLLFLETQAIVGNLYSWGSVVHIDRIRPLVYNHEVPWGERTGIRTKNAFYSGHTSLSASASFFAAKVYSDYNPELGNKKYLVYSLAIIPPVATGLFRYKSLKHFPSDVITGLALSYNF